MTKSVSAIAAAKLNLYLHITGRREDGYHLLESIFVRTRGGDKITIKPASELTLSITGPFSEGLSSDENLIMDAARALLAVCDKPLGADILLKKNLPVASGIGGGSADAATTLLLLNDLWELGLSIKELELIGQPLGADVAACLYDEPLWVRGIGEIIELAKPKVPSYCILINPLITVSTPDVFARFKEQGFKFQKQNEKPLFDLRDISSAENVLSSIVCQQFGAVRELLSAMDGLDGVKLSRMSGSGATCFALFEKEDEREQAYRRLKTMMPDYWLICDEIIV